MDLYLMRHGIAVPRQDSTSASDRERPLTEKGIKRMRRAVKGLSVLKIRFDRILTSPLRRARQTAEIVAETLGIQGPHEELEELAPDSSPEQFISRIAGYPPGKLLLVGHQPLLGEIAKHLLKSTEAKVNFKKGGLCRIEVEDPPQEKAAVLHWMLTPKQLRRVAGH